MRTKQWITLGVTLIGVHAALLAGARAAEMVPLPRPGFHSFEGPLSRFWGKPLPVILSPVTLRLFSNQKIKTLWIKNSDGFKLGDRTLKGDFYIQVQGPALSVISRGQRLQTSREFTFQFLGGSVYELKVHKSPSVWTRGDLRVRSVKGRLEIVNRLGLEDYVSGIVEGELGTLRLNPEVLKAQIIVARSYVLAMRGEQHPGEGYEFCDHPHCQVYHGIPQHHPAFDAALRAVRGQYISYKHHPIAAFYHHDCGGTTSAVQDVWPSPGRPYLIAVGEPAESACHTRRSEWRVVLPRKTLAALCRKAGWLPMPEALDTVRVIQADRSGRAEHILIQGHNPKWISVSHFRNAVNQSLGKEALRSALFTISLEGDTFVFKGRGWGHGVGFCQEGATWLSRHGKTYVQILQHYFPHTQISQLN